MELLDLAFASCCRDLGMNVLGLSSFLYHVHFIRSLGLWSLWKRNIKAHLPGNRWLAPWQPPQPVLEHNLQHFATDTLHQHTFTPIISNSSEQLDIEREASKTTTAYIPDHALVQATASRGASP